MTDLIRIFTLFSVALILVTFTSTFFIWALPYMEACRVEHPWLYLCLPLLTLFIWWDRKHPQDVLSTREEVRALSRVSPGSRPTTWAAGLKQIFMTLGAHLAGASIGREAVGLQLGGWSARLRATNGWYFGACLAAGFAIILGTPFAAAIFIFESKRWSLSWTDWLGIPLLAWLAYQASLLVGVSHSAFVPFGAVVTELQSIPVLKLLIFLLALVILGTALAFLFLVLVRKVGSRKSPHLSGLILPLVFLSLVGAVFWYFSGSVEALGLPGLGISILKTLPIAEPALFSISNHPLMFGVIKVLLTAAFVGIGLRGGEFTPLLVAGAMVSIGLAALMGLPIAGFLHLGLPLVWGIASRRPWTSAVIALEIFGFGAWGVLGVLVFALVFAGVRLGDLAFGRLFKSEAWRHGLYD